MGPTLWCNSHSRASFGTSLRLDPCWIHILSSSSFFHSPSEESTLPIHLLTRIPSQTPAPRAPKTGSFTLWYHLLLQVPLPRKSREYRFSSCILLDLEICILGCGNSLRLAVRFSKTVKSLSIYNEKIIVSIYNELNASVLSTVLGTWHLLYHSILPTSL